MHHFWHTCAEKTLRVFRLAVKETHPVLFVFVRKSGQKRGIKRAFKELSSVASIYKQTKTDFALSGAVPPTVRIVAVSLF